ncbi:MAG TPA: HD domain-containing protein [Candidatus Saccharimonadales bacterium]|nr:HD domain-containing protein [Candidatus Saccharimonadales bacterium]
MNHIVPEEILKIYMTFHNAGYKLYLVGGSVRAMILHKDKALENIKDWDLTTDATPEEMMKLFPNAFYDNSFGTVGLPIGSLKDVEHAGIVEITTFRTEKGYDDNRHPSEVSWGKTIEEDLSRRDFTMNAIAIELTEEFKTNPTFIDPFDGQKDIKDKLIRAVGDPDHRFKEDALRLMRAIRFAAQLGFEIEEKTLASITNDAELLSKISGERIRDELMKLLSSDYPYEGIMLLKNTGLLHQILPELLEGISVSQMRPGRHHKDDVFTHNVLSLKHCPSTNPIVRFATLIHDIGKPRVASADEEGYVIFHNHEIVGSRMAYDICDRLRLSKKQRDKIFKLIRWHMFTVDEHITDSAVRRFIRRIGVENVKDMMDLRVGDRLGGGTQTAESWRLKLFKKRVEEQLAPAPFSINDLAIDGNDVMKELHIKPGRQIGEILQKLFEEVDEDLSKNTKEYLLKIIKEIT